MNKQIAAELLRIARELTAKRIRNVKDAMDTVKKMDNLIDDLEEEWAAVAPVHRVGEPGPPESDMSVLLAKLQENITELQKFLKTMK